MNDSSIRREGIVEPTDMSKEQREQFHRLLDKLTEIIWENVERPQPKPRLQLVEPRDLDKYRRALVLLASALPTASSAPQPRSGS